MREFSFHDPYHSIEQMHLLNGLSAYVKQWPSANWLQFGVVIHAGARHDPSNRQGLAHFVEHVLAENVEKYTFLQLKDLFYKFGATVSFGATGYGATTFTMKLPLQNKTVHDALRLFGQMLLCGNLLSGIKHERTIIGREYHDTYPHALSRTWALQGRPYLFTGHPQLRSYDSPLGVLEEVMQSTLGELQDFYDRYYTPANMSIAIMSPLPTEEALALLEHTAFAGYKMGQRIPLPLPFSPQPPLQHEKTILLSDFSQLTYVHAYCTTEWVVPLSFREMSVILFCGLLREALYERLRYSDLALTYEVKVSYLSYQECWTLYVYFEVPPNTVSVSYELLWESLRSVHSMENLFLQRKKVHIDHLCMLDLAGFDLMDRMMEDLEERHSLLSYTDELVQVEQTHLAEVAALATYLTPNRAYTFISKP